MRRRKPDPINQIANQPLDVTQGIPRGTKTGKTNSTQDINGTCDRSINNINPFMPDVPLHSGLLLKLLTQQNTNKISYDPNINLDFEEYSPFQEGIMSETLQRLDKSFFQNPKELGEVINKENLIHKFLPRQADIDKILKIIQRKVLRGTYLPVEIKEIQVGYLQSPYFKDLYQYYCKISSQVLKQPSKVSGTIREISLTRFPIIQNLSKKRDSGSSHTRNVHGQDNNFISQKSVCRTSRSN